ncbi:MAG: serine/threonine-protein phosphatase [Solirubrobacterales bacterium]|nr:serine/threonine-protein phosphatase [Solirubrobacterales bacterium]
MFDRIAPDPSAMELLAFAFAARLGERLVEEAQRIAGCRVALYVVDINGGALRHAGGEIDAPEVLPIDRGVGPEIPADHAPGLEASVRAAAPGVVVVPLWLRSRTLAALLCEREPEGSLVHLIEHAAAAIELADNYTDVFDVARRGHDATPAAELQQDLLPPRIAYVEGAEMAANLLPAYDVGGDWFDHAADTDGAWFAVADAVGKGPRAAALSALAIGAYRSGRRRGRSLQEVAAGIARIVGQVGEDSAYITAVLGRWHAPDHTFSWVRCGHPLPAIWKPDGTLEELDDVGGLPLGLGSPEVPYEVGSRRLEPGERLLIYSDGVTERRTPDGRFGLAGLVRALTAAPSGSASSAAASITAQVLTASERDLRDDATVLVLAPGQLPMDQRLRH